MKFKIRDMNNITYIRTYTRNACRGLLGVGFLISNQVYGEHHRFISLNYNLPIKKI